MPINFDLQLYVGGFPKVFHFYDPFRSLKMVSFAYLNDSEISQTILQKSTNFIDDFPENMHQLETRVGVINLLEIIKVG